MLLARRCAWLGPALLCACPQAIESLDGGLPAGPDAAFVAPTCASSDGPAFSCSPGVSPMLDVNEIATFTCALPGGSRTVRFKAPQTDHPGASVAFDSKVSADNATGTVAVQLQKPSLPFADSTIRLFLTLAWDDAPDSCTVFEVDSRWAGDLWVADPDNEQVVVLDSSGQPAGDPLKLDGMQQPRALGRASDGVLVAGQNAGSLALSVYDLSGNKVRDVAGLDALGEKPARAVASLGSSIYLATGRSDTDAEVYRIANGTPAKLTTPVASLAAVSEGTVIAGNSMDATFLVLTSDHTDGQAVSAIYRDSTGAACPVHGAFAAAALSSGGFALSLRHLDGGGAPTLGLMALFDASWTMLHETAHTDAALPGDLMVPGSFDWLEELRPGVLVGGRDTGATLQSVDASSVGTKDTVQPWGNLPPSTMPKGLYRLR